MSTETVAKPDEDLSAYVAGEIRAQLGRLNISRVELARRAGKDETWVGKRLNGRREITINDLERIARALRIEPGKLLPRVTLPYLPPVPSAAIRRPPSYPAGRGRPGRPTAPSSPLRHRAAA